MKKLMTLLLSFVLVLSLAACGGSKTQSTSDKTTKSSQKKESTKKDTKKGSKDTEEENEETEKESKDTKKESKDTKKESKDSGTDETAEFDEMVAIDNEECVIKITGIDPENIWGYTLKAELENKSDDKNYMFTVESASINGIQCDPFFAVELSPGQKNNENIMLSNDLLNENGIEEYTDIEVDFRVYDINDWAAEPAGEETIHIYPYGEEKASTFVREAQADDNVIIDNDSVTVIVTGYKKADIWGYTVNLFLQNKTDKKIMFTVDDASVNGYMADPFYATTVSGGNCEFSTMSWSDSTLEENGITEVEKIEGKFRAYDVDDILGEDFANEEFTLNP